MNRALPTFEEALSRNKLSHFVDQGYDLKGIIQGGANDGEEMENAVRLGVENYVAFEPLESAFDLLAQIPVPDNYYLFQLGLHNRNRLAKLKVTAGDGKGSSLYDGVWDHPEVLKNWTQGQAAIVGEEEIELQRFDTWARQNPSIDLSLFDTLQLDTQGNEMEILQGMTTHLHRFKYLCIELSVTPVYKGETPGQKVADWLNEKGFILDSPIYEHNDAFFIRKDIKPESEGIYYGRC